MKGEREMYVYKRIAPELFTVGHYEPNEDGAVVRWRPESDYGTFGEAAARVHYLNGGEWERGRKVSWVTGTSEDRVVHIGRLVELVVVSDSAGLNRPCMVVEQADGSVELAWIAFNDVRFVG